MPIRKSVTRRAPALLDEFERYQLLGYVLRGIIFQLGMERQLESACFYFPAAVTKAKKKIGIEEQ